MVSSAIADARVGGLLSSHHPLGTSTGHLTELRGQWDMLVTRAFDVSTLAVELAALSEPEFLSLCDWLAASRRELPFRFLSVHAPTKHRELPESALVERLRALPAVVDAIVVHPDAIERPERYAALGATVVLENMDARKADGRTADELEPFFAALPEAGFCLDVPHAQSIDPSLDEAQRLLDAFGERLRHVHLSSLDEHCHHVPLRPADEEAFGPVLQRCLDVPWILEAPLPPR
ncbi:TIM barrel protein [Patulibacter defluvii]|uniref:TIM barrel protein n=1 Tax=Patulibacter defluvii TaxID=3095358 RepID=UPI002A764122|nr:TIM barrel protein [Patulibacter sp. DM4]